jgi:hypothetical protein
VKPTRPYSRHGLNALKARVKLRGLNAIDRRTVAGRTLVAWRAELLADLGGEETLSAQQRKLADLSARAAALLDHVDAWLFSQESLVNTRRRSVLPVLLQRQSLADHLARLLGQLGLERRAKPLPSLSQVLAQREGEKQ